MIRFFFLLLLSTLAFGARVENFTWKNGETYLEFLERQNLPTRDLYYNLDKDDQKQTEEVLAGVHAQILLDDNKAIEQVLIPLNDELQVHIYKFNNQYLFEAIPIISETRTESLTLNINSSPYYDILKATHSKKIATIFVGAFKKSLNFKTDLRKGDRLAMIYTQKYRLGKIFSMPELQVAMIEMRNKEHFIYLNSDDRYYDENAKRVESFLLATPVRGARISSKFSKRRWHPVLHKYRAHLGIDFAARRGTPVLAAADGTIIRANRSYSYGNVIYIRHKDGYSTRYAHLKSFKRGIRYGRYVKRGQVIGYVGTTGRSTGPHLHFELRKNNVAINPLRSVQVTTKVLQGKAKEKFLKLKETYDAQIATVVKNDTPFVLQKEFRDVCYFNNPYGIKLIQNQ